jgi:RimJ/RimL family protein N-acetyltransferase
MRPWGRNTPVRLESERLVLRALELADLDNFVANIDDEVRRWQGWREVPVAHHRHWLARLAQQRRRRLPLNLAITEQPDGPCLGVYTIEPTSPDSAQLGWWLGPAGRGRGFGSESLPVAIAYAETQLGFSRIVMGTAVDNVRAIAMITRAGAVRDYGKRHRLPNGERTDSIWYAHHRDAQR